MTFLELCNLTLAESGETFDEIAAVSLATGYQKLVVGWVADAWADVQRGSNRWDWAWREFDLDVTSGTRQYAMPVVATESIEQVDWRSMTLERVGDFHRYPVEYLSWDKHRDLFVSLSDTPTQQPNRVTLTPANMLRFNTVPDQAYTLRGEGWLAAQVLAASGDVPRLPAAYHRLLMFIALFDYGRWEAAPEQLSAAHKERETLEHQLFLRHGPRVRLAGNVF